MSNLHHSQQINQTKLTEKHINRAKNKQNPKFINKSKKKKASKPLRHPRRRQPTLIIPDEKRKKKKKKHKKVSLRSSFQQNVMQILPKK